MASQLAERLAGAHHTMGGQVSSTIIALVMTVASSWALPIVQVRVRPCLPRACATPGQAHRDPAVAPGDARSWTSLAMPDEALHPGAAETHRQGKVSRGSP
jgi:hypothetical protein